MQCHVTLGDGITRSRSMWPACRHHVGASTVLGMARAPRMEQTWSASGVGDPKHRFSESVASGLQFA